MHHLEAEVLSRLQGLYIEEEDDDLIQKVCLKPFWNSNGFTLFLNNVKHFSKRLSTEPNRQSSFMYEPVPSHFQIFRLLFNTSILSESEYYTVASTLSAAEIQLLYIRVCSKRDSIDHHRVITKAAGGLSVCGSSLFKFMEIRRIQALRYFHELLVIPASIRRGCVSLPNV